MCTVSVEVNMSQLACLSFSPSWDTWHCSSARYTHTCMAGADSSLPPPINGTLLQATCSVSWCLLWCWCSSFWSSCPAWTARSPASDEAGKGPIQKTTPRNRCWHRTVTITGTKTMEDVENLDTKTQRPQSDLLPAESALWRGIVLDVIDPRLYNYTHCSALQRQQSELGQSLCM